MSCRPTKIKSQELPQSAQSPRRASLSAPLLVCVKSLKICGSRALSPEHLSCRGS